MRWSQQIAVGLSSAPLSAFSIIIIPPTDMRIERVKNEGGKEKVSTEDAKNKVRITIQVIVLYGGSPFNANRQTTPEHETRKQTYFLSNRHFRT
jgi:hypothetical protein